MANVQRGWSIFPCKRNSENYKDIVEDLLNGYQTMGLNMSMKIHFLQFHLEPGRSDLRTVGKVSRGYFQHGDKVRRKVVTEHGS